MVLSKDMKSEEENILVKVPKFMKCRQVRTMQELFGRSTIDCKLLEDND